MGQDQDRTHPNLSQPQQQLRKLGNAYYLPDLFNQTWSLYAICINSQTADCRTKELDELTS
jgi:hypothetical protein